MLVALIGHTMDHAGIWTLLEVILLSTEHFLDRECNCNCMWELNMLEAAEGLYNIAYNNLSTTVQCCL